MTPLELKTIRNRAGMGVVQFGRALGYTGNDNTLSVHVRAMENGNRPIMPRVEAAACWVKRVVDAIDRALAQGGGPAIVLLELDRAGFSIRGKGRDSNGQENA